jgi:hypothetical protein
VGTGKDARPRRGGIAADNALLYGLQLLTTLIDTVVGYEPAGDALISTTTRATLMLSIIPLYHSWNRHGTVLLGHAVVDATGV